MISFQAKSYRTTWLTSSLIAILGHTLVIALLLLNPNFRILLPEKVEAPEVRLVRLKGGGENRPGWIKPTTAPSDNSPVADAKPKPKPIVDKPKDTPAPPKIEKVQPKVEEPVVTQNETRVIEEVVVAGDTPVTETGITEEAVSESPQTAIVNPEETGEGVGDKPGPEGPGLGIHSDAAFTGADVYLSRLEVEVQRRFNFNGRGSGVMAEYHFFIDKRGKIKEMVLMKTSGIPSLDLAARSALMRAKFPPLPKGFEHEKLGVTYRFYDAK